MTGTSGYVVVTAVILAGILLVTAGMTARRLIAPRAATPAKLTTYESGVDPVGVGWAQSQIRYVGFAFLYVVFAVDAVYLFPWALVVRHPDLGLRSLVEIGVFIAILLVGLVHAARRGLLRWACAPRHPGWARGSPPHGSGPDVWWPHLPRPRVGRAAWATSPTTFSRCRSGSRRRSPRTSAEVGEPVGAGTTPAVHPSAGECARADLPVAPARR